MQKSEANDAVNMVEVKINVKKDEISLGQPMHAVVPLRLEWYKVCKTVKVVEGRAFRKTKSEKQILKSVTGVVEPGELLAVMGPSGSVKTSLLNSLAKRQGITSGKILLNGEKIPKNFNKLSAYVMQDDRLFETLTPRELFQFSAQLRLPRGTTQKEKDEMVETVIKKLKMTSCADTRVGGHLLRGLSGGERKRASIGYEMIVNPSLLFLDEPTSGLDSFTALTLINCLRDLCKEGHTVICTIHQPSSTIFALLDRLLLLVQGEVAYLGKVSDSVEFFASLGYPCPTYTNPADFYMVMLQTQNEEEITRCKMFVEATAKLLPKYTPRETETGGNPIKSEKRANFLTQLRELTKRGWQTVVRNPLSFMAKFGQTIALSILVSLVYLKMGTDQSGVTNRDSALFFITMSQTIIGLNAVLLTFPLERSLLIREQSNGMYSVSSYFLGKFLSGLPLDFFFPSLFSVIIYWTLGLNDSSPARFFCFLLALFSISICASSIGLSLGCILPNAETAVAIAPFAFIPFIPLFKFGYQSLIINEMTNLNFTCTESQYLQVQSPIGVVEVCPITSGEQILDTLSYTWVDYWQAIGVLLGLFAFFRLLALFALVLQTRIALKRTQT